MRMHVKNEQSKLIIELEHNVFVGAGWLLFELYDSSLIRLHGNWEQARRYEINGIDAGVYVVKLSSPNGNSLEKAVEVKTGEPTMVVLGLEPEEGQMVNVMTKTPVYRLWQLTEGIWNIKKDYRQPQEISSYISNRENFEMREIFGLEIFQEDMEGGPDVRFYIIPPGMVTIKIYPSTRPDCVDKVIIQTNNSRADALGQLLINGDMTKAKILVQYEQASQLILNKEFDHAAAAIAGYYLLRVNQLNYLYEWILNLPSWFPKTADEAIVQGWFLLQSITPKDQVISEFKEWMLEAVNRGMPIYSEGIQLLYEGLKQLKKYFRSDVEIDSACKNVEVFVEHMVSTELYTTMKNYLPVERFTHWKKVEGLSGWEEHIAYTLPVK